MKRAVLFIFLLVTVCLSFGQKNSTPTKSFTIMGEIKTPVTVNVEDLKKFAAVAIEDVSITNHLGEVKSLAKGLKGVLLKDILATVEITASSPKVLSEYYFVCKANDGYTAVYSWNELFNTAVGDASYVITEKNGKSATEMDDSILLLSPKDFKTGRRHVKSLVSIDVRHAK